MHNLEGSSIGSSFSERKFARWDVRTGRFFAVWQLSEDFRLWDGSCCWPCSSLGGAVGTGANTEDRIAALIDAEVDVLVIDTAHGHSEGVLKRVHWIKQHYPDIQLIAGNIATHDAALALAEAGVDAVTDNR